MSASCCGGSPDIEVVSDGDRCGEGPIWDAEERRLIWTDIEGGFVQELSPARGERRLISRGLQVNGIALNRGGELVFAGPSGLTLWRRGELDVVVSSRGGEPLSFNDLIADAEGRIYAGTLCWGANGMERTGKLLLIVPDGEVEEVDDGIELANGIGLSPDGATLYFADSAARRILAYDVERVSGRLGRKRVFAAVPAEAGLPDGLTVDADGHVWCAQWYGGQVVRYDPEGRVERRIVLPVKQVSSLAFGGDDLTDLYVTTAGEPWRSQLAPAEFDWNAPLGGPLYRVHAGIAGRLEHRSAFGWKRR